MALLLRPDFSKVFDRVDREILQKKLSNYGADGNAMNCIQSYLTNMKSQTGQVGSKTVQYG